jgi:hypothetical protein
VRQVPKSFRHGRTDRLAIGLSPAVIMVVRSLRCNA